MMINLSMPQPRQFLEEELVVTSLARRTVFKPRQRKLIVYGFGRNDQPPADILLPLTEQGVLSDAYMPLPGRFGGQRLELVMAEHDDLPPIHLLYRLARIVARTSGQRSVLDPWERSDTSINVQLAADVIGEILRRASRRSRVGARR